MLANPDLDSPQQCLQLPPSLELGDLYIEEFTGKRFAQPSIVYLLRGSVSVKAGRDSESKSLETVLPVVVTAHTQEFPPTEIKDFPGEFKEEESKVLRRTLIGSPLGAMRVSIREPPPLTYSIGAAGSGPTSEPARPELYNPFLDKDEDFLFDKVFSKVTKSKPFESSGYDQAPR